MPNIVTHDHPEPEPLDDDPEVANAIKVVIAAVGLAPTPGVLYQVLGQLCPELSGVQIAAVLRHFDGAAR